MKGNTRIHTIFPAADSDTLARLLKLKPAAAVLTHRFDQLLYCVLQQPEQLHLHMQLATQHTPTKDVVL